MEPSRQPLFGRTEAHNDQPRGVSQLPQRCDRPRNRGQSENDGHLPPWQEAVGHEIIPDTHKNGRANEATTGLTLGLFVMLFQDVVFG
jgi:hypothetical protein